MGQIRSLESFDDRDRASVDAARLRMELAERQDPLDTEIVVLEATSEEELRKTHRRYFASASELAKSAADDATTASVKSAH